MTATIVPFPIARRRAFIEKASNRIVSGSVAEGNRYYNQQLNLYCDALRRMGVADDMVRREIQSLDMALQAAGRAAQLTSK